MNRLNPQIKLYVTVAISIAIFGAVIALVVVPLVGKINSTSSEFSAIKQQIADIGEKRSQIYLIEQEFNAIKDSIAKVDSALADQSNFLDALINLEKIAEDTDNRHEISIIEPSKKGADSLKFLYFRVTLNGTFESIINFVNSLENAQFYGKIEKIELIKTSAPATGPSIENMRAIMEIKIYTK